MVAQESAPAIATPIGMLALFAAPLVQRLNGADLSITLLPVLQELNELQAICEELDPPVALAIEPQIATAERIGHIFATRRSFDILHFTGHGSQEKQRVVLALEDDNGALRPMPGDELQSLFNGPPCHLAFLSACHSQGLADALLAAGVQHVVAINAADAVLDLAARAFAKRFYPALLAGSTVQRAFEMGLAAVRSNDDLRRLRDPQTLQPVSMQEALKFRLLPEDDSIHAQPLTDAMPAGVVQMLRSPWEHTNLDAGSADTFVGRSRELHEIAVKLHASRCVHIKGVGGMGKTALARAAGRWQHERQRYRDGVWLVELRNIGGAAEARNRIAAALNLDPKLASDDAVLAGALREWRGLLILDDLDVLLERDRSGLAELLRKLLGARYLRLLTTSRRDLPGQVDHALVELTRLAPGDDLEASRSYHPVVEEWGEWQPQQLDDLLQFLGGYPFPIRLATTFMKQSRCGLVELLRRLRENPRGTLHYPGDPTDHDTSLAATLDLSYDALPDEAKHALPLLALFPGGLTRHARRTHPWRSACSCA